MADISWSLPHTGSSESVSNIEVLWINSTIYVTCWVDSSNTGIKVNVYQGVDGIQTHLHSQALFTYGALQADPIQMAKVRDNVWVIAFTEAVGLKAVRVYMFTWDGSTVTNHGQITFLSNQQTRYGAICSKGEDNIHVWGRRYDLQNILYSRYGTYDGSTWTFSGYSSITPIHYANALRACEAADGKGLLLWNKVPGDDGRCHGFTTLSGGGGDIKAVDGTRSIKYINCCKLADNRIIACVYSWDSSQSGLAYAITLEEESPFQLRPTIGDAFTFHLGVARNVTCAATDSTHFLVAYEERDDSNKGKTRYCRVDWNTRIITAGDVEIFSENVIGGSNTYGIGMASNTDGIIALAYRDEDDNNYVKTILGGLIDHNVFTSVIEIEGLLKAKEISSLHNLQEIDYLYNAMDLSPLYSVADTELYTVKESELYSVISLPE